MPDIVLAIATTLATKGAEAVAEGGRNAIAALIGMIRRRRAAGGGRATALDRVITHPADREAPERGLVVNHVSGTAHKVVQARDVHGDISL
ncbi:hypothetical protein [Dactylosporangium sp. CA-139066]|uniref:hypothetical protein n=1 Tax=Dactylosporangium sp. CA-139066 TaxID=3239930 RepID=UPI003D8E6C5B